MKLDFFFFLTFPLKSSGLPEASLISFLSLDPWPGPQFSVYSLIKISSSTVKIRDHKVNAENCPFFLTGMLPSFSVLQNCHRLCEPCGWCPRLLHQLPAMSLTYTISFTSMFQHGGKEERWISSWHPQHTQKSKLPVLFTWFSYYSLFYSDFSSPLPWLPYLNFV